MAGLEDYIRYANSGAIRNKPLDPKLVESLGFLKDLGVTAEVFSGGQDAEGPNRTGSHRHDGGGSGDMRFYKGDRQLDWANKDDVPLFQQIVQQGKQRGITGFGAGPGYMGPGTMHVGFGAPAVWGAGGSGDTAPSWLKAAYNGVAGAGDPVNEVLAAKAGIPASTNPLAKFQMASAAPLSMGAPQGVVTPGPDGVMPPLDAAPGIPAPAAASPAPAMALGDKVGNAIFGEDLAASLKKTFGPDAAANSPGKAGLGLLGSAMSGNKGQEAANREAATITPSAALADDSASRMAAGTQLMATLMANRRKPRPSAMGMRMGA